MQKYYKIITEKSWFKKIYDFKDVSDIPYGTMVEAQEPFSNDPQYTIGKRKHWYIKQPVIHFCDNAFDTMLWQPVLVGTLVPKKYQIYEIKPITPIVKEKCADEYGIYQCGAKKVEILGKMNDIDMYDLAVAEFHKDRSTKIDSYLNLNLPDIVEDWENHEMSENVNPYLSEFLPSSDLYFCRER